MKYPFASPPQKPYGKSSRELEKGITASSHIFIFKCGAFAAEKKACEIGNCCLKETKHDDESLAGKSPKNLAECENYACMEKN